MEHVAQCGCRSVASRRRKWARAAAAALLCVWPGCGAAAGGVDPRFAVAPYLRDATVDGVTVLWETTTPRGSAVEYGTQVPLTRRAEVPGLGTFHRVRIEGLDPARTCFYRVVPSTDDPEGPSSLPTPTRTARPAGVPVTFAVVGDTQDQTGRWGVIAEEVRSRRPDFVLHVGDIVEEGPEANRWRDEFFAPGRALLATTPIWAVLGNHEADSPLYYRYFGGPAPGWRQTFVFGDVQVFLVDSERPLGPGSEQHAWLDAALAASTAPWRFVALHRPPYTSDRDDYGDTAREGSLQGDPRTRVLVPLLEKHRVDVLFCGHIHAYERTHPIRAGRVDDDGTVYVTTGGAGGHLEESADVRSWFTASLRRCHHYVIASVCGDALELRAYDEEGRLFDQAVRTRRSGRDPRMVAALYGPTR